MKYDFLRNVPLFSSLPGDDLERLCLDAEEIELTEGQHLFSEGDMAEMAYVIKDGEIEVVKESNGREVLLAVRGPGEVIGEMALLEAKPRMASVRARTPSTLVGIRKEQIDELLATSLSAATTMFYTVLGRWRTSEAMLIQSEKMAELGTLTAGVAHELNNPAAAVQRGTSQLQAALAQQSQAQAALGDLLTRPELREKLDALESRVREQSGPLPGLDALARSDRESELEGWLEAQGATNVWDIAPKLVDLGFEPAQLDELAPSFPPGTFPRVAAWLAAIYTVNTLVAEVLEGARRISAIIKALKSYSYLDQAPVQAVNIQEGIENTLLILRSKLKTGITVHREYAPDLPAIQGYGSELNQVWTNILDNAVDALGGQGEITIRTRAEDKWVVVEIEDNGPGMPPAVQKRIFEPFFTTKPVGKGTGLGLHISYNIVVHKHRGDIKVFSEPGKTCFQVRLPVNFEAKKR